MDGSVDLPGRISVVFVVFVVFVVLAGNGALHHQYNYHESVVPAVA